MGNTGLDEYQNVYFELDEVYNPKAKINITKLKNIGFTFMIDCNKKLPISPEKLKHFSYALDNLI
jgi:hypothetical protein